MSYQEWKETISMRIIDLLQADKQTSKWIVDNYKRELLIVDDSFQRKYVWVEKHQINLIETILLGYAIPEIYLWVVDTDATTGETKYSIVDGQQRIGAVFDFIDGKFKLDKTYLSDKEASYVGKTFKELDDEQKKIIWSYPFTIRQIPCEVNRDEIVKMFLRLNSTDKSLNPQELRNAEFNGKFLNNAKRIAELDFWKRNKIFGVNHIRRMKDIEFISSILIFLRNGIDSEITQQAINKMYDLFNDEYKENDNDYNTTNNILKEIQEIIDYDPNTLKVISKTTHLYTLFTLTYIIITQNSHFTNNQKQLLSKFYNDYDNDIKDIDIEEYKHYSKDATNSKTSRTARLNILRKYLNI